MWLEVLGVTHYSEKETIVSISPKLVFIGLVVMLLSQMAYMTSAKAFLVF